MECGIAGWGVVRIPWGEIPQRRKYPGPSGSLKPASNLKLADEQTVVACAAVLDACARMGWSPEDFTDWGVLAAPTYIGRARLAPSFRRFQKSGARGVSPLIIPTMSNHAVAGTLCLILRSHGLNFGIGGSTPMLDELLLNAMSLCDGDNCPGIWAVMTAWQPEAIPDGDGQSNTSALGVGVALAITSNVSGDVVQLDLSRPAGVGLGTVFELADFLEADASGASWQCPLPGGGALTITRRAAVRRLAG